MRWKLRASLVSTASPSPGLRSGVDMRPTLLRILTDLYVQKLRHTPEEERHYTELALRLLGAVDVPTRAAVAARLAARHLSPPLLVLQYLSRDLPEVAEPLRTHVLLQPPAPVPTTAPHAEQIRVKVNNSEHELSAGDQRDLADENDALFAHVTPAVDPVTAGELNELFFAADPNERRLILLNLDVVAPLPPDRTGLARDPSASERLEAAALARSNEEVARHLMHSLRIPRAQARRMVHDHLGEPIVVAAKAIDVPRAVLYRILLFANAAVGHSVERVHALAALYDEITMQAAEGMVAIWQSLQNDERAAAKYQPVTWSWRHTHADVRRRLRNAPRSLPRRKEGPSALRRTAARPRLDRRRHGTELATYPGSSGADVQKIAAGPVLDLHDPDVRVKFHLSGEIGLDFRISSRQRHKARRERTGRPFCSLERALRRWAKQIGSAVEPVDANEYGARFLGAASTQDAEYALDLAAAQIGGDPERSLRRMFRYSTVARRRTAYPQIARLARCRVRNAATAADGRSWWPIR